MALFSSSVPFRSSWWADPIPEIDEDFWPLGYFDVLAPYGLPRSVLRAQRSLQHGSQKNVLPHEVLSDKDKFKVTLHIPHFKTNEISVKVIDKYLDVIAEHQEKQDEHGHVSRRFHRRYLLPHNADLDQFSSTYSDDGTLVVCAPKKQYEAKTERTIEVKHVPSEHQQTSDVCCPPEEKTSGIKIPVSHVASSSKK